MITTHAQIIAACAAAREATMRALAHLERCEERIRDRKKIRENYCSWAR